MKNGITLPLFLFVGLLSGTTLALLTHYAVNESLPYVWISLFGTFFLLSSAHTKKYSALCITAFITSFLASIPYLSHARGYYIPLTFSQITLATVCAYALNAFHIQYVQQGFQFSYPILFRGLWDSFSELFIAFFFTLLCWAILILTSALFSSVDVTILKNLISKNWFDALITPIFFSTGLLIAITKSSITQGFRHFFLLACEYLLPPLAIISLLFIITLAIKHSLTTSDQLLFLSIAFLSSVFINGIYQDGTIENPYKKILWKIVQLFLILSPIFTILSLYQITFIGNNSLEKTGLTTQNFSYLINVILLFIYTVFYAVIATHTTPWLKGLQKTNIILGFVLIAATLATNNPITLLLIPKPKNPPLFYHDTQHQKNALSTSKPKKPH